jgi:hypothetical protein
MMSAESWDAGSLGKLTMVTFVMSVPFHADTIQPAAAERPAITTDPIRRSVAIDGYVMNHPCMVALFMPVRTFPYTTMS